MITQIGVFYLFLTENSALLACGKVAFSIASVKLAGPPNLEAFGNHFVPVRDPTDSATGGGGANVWQPHDVANALQGTGFELADLGDVSYTIAIRRAERIGESGIDIEDVGVSTPFTHAITLDDLTNPTQLDVEVASAPRG